MKEVIAFIAIMLLGAFAATKAEGFFIHPSHQDLLSPLYSALSIDNESKETRHNEITTLSTKISSEENPYVRGVLAQVLLHLIALQDQKNTIGYSTITL